VEQRYRAYRLNASTPRGAQQTKVNVTAPVREKPDHLMSTQFPAQNNPLIGIHAMKLEHFFRRIHANTDQLGHDGFLHWTLSSSVSSQDRCEPSTPSVLSENQHLWLSKQPQV
jgi:hypothetical protein